jgi:hypothetical protein
MKKNDAQIQTPTKRRQTMPKNPVKPTRTPERRNPASNK